MKALIFAASLVLAADAAGASEHVVTVDGRRIDVTLAAARGTQTSDLLAWVEDAAHAVSGYVGRFPVPRVRLRIVAGSRSGVHGGVTRGGNVPSIRVTVGPDTSRDELRDDWVLVHEMLHLAFPDLITDDSWAEEGLSMYAEPLARARAGLMTTEKAWIDLVDGLPKGLPQRGDEGLHGTDAWGRTYWGGALFWLLADVKLRQATKGRGVDGVLHALQQAGGDIRSDWPLSQVLETGDRALGTRFGL